MLTIQKLHIVSKLVLYKDSVHYFKMNAKATSLWVSDHRILLSILPLKSFFLGSAVILWKERPPISYVIVMVVYFSPEAES